MLMLFNHCLKQLLVLLIQRIEQHHFYIAVFDERFVHVPYVSNTTTHACSKIPSCLSKHNYCSASHVFAAVITNSFNNYFHPGVANGKSLTCQPFDECFTRSSTIKCDITDNHIFSRVKLALCRGI